MAAIHWPGLIPASVSQLSRVDLWWRDGRTSTNNLTAIPAVPTVATLLRGVSTGTVAHVVTSLCGGVIAACRCRARSERRLQRPNERQVITRAFEYELGVQPPLGYFDPLGLAADGDVSEFKRRREVELKHGRVAMYATLGYMFPELFRWPGYCSLSFDLTFEDIPNGLRALDYVPVEGWLQILAWCGYNEIVVNQPQHPREPGNYYRGRFGANPRRIMTDKDLRRRGLNSELANGRLAMIAIIWMWMQDILTGKAWGSWSLFFAATSE